MALSIGIAGLPNVGKSTIFNALTRAQNAQAANYPFCTIEPNKATVPVPDERVEALEKKVRPRKTIHATVDFIDIAGLVRGASKGEGLGNQFLGNIRECAAILHVVRCFEDGNVVHVEGGVDPMRDIDVIETEFLLADIQTVEKRMERLSRQAKGDKDAKAALEYMKLLLEHLNNGNPASSFNLPDNDSFLANWREMGLLTAKPMIYCANVDETCLEKPNKYVKQVMERAKAANRAFVGICASLEEELAGLDLAEGKEMLASFGQTGSGLDAVIKEGYKLLGLCSYFTAGPDEVRAWTIHKGWKAPKAAGVIHGDFEKGFIRAEIISYDDYMSHANEGACRADGVLRTEGKEYVMRDGDVAHFLFNV